jgi:hypothetical protein
VTRRHYEDVVVPFRKRRPWYQRSWRLTRQLGEIREELRPLGGGLVASVRRVVSRAKALLEAAPEDAQVGMFSRDFVKASLKPLGAVVEALEVLEASVARLAQAGG